MSLKYEPASEPGAAHRKRAAAAEAAPAAESAAGHTPYALTLHPTPDEPEPALHTTHYTLHPITHTTHSHAALSQTPAP